MVGDNRLIAGFGFQAAFGFNCDDCSVRERYHPIRAVCGSIMAAKCWAVAVKPPISALFLQNKPGELVIKVMFQRPVGDFCRLKACRKTVIIWRDDCGQSVVGDPL